MKERLLRRPLLVAGLALIVALVPAMAFASHGFEDVPDDHNFHNDIAWMQETGVTRGCNPPANTLYCPERALIRGEEAAFFHRYDRYLRESLEARLVPAECEEGQIAEFDGEAWQCADSTNALSVEVGDTVAIAVGETEDVVVACAEGDVLVTANLNPANGDLAVVLDIVGNEATFMVTNDGADPVEVTAYAVCASI